MQTTPSNNTAISSKYSVPLLLGLIAAGLAGNHFSFPLFLNIDFLFGSIFTLLALQLLGLGRGILAATAIAAYTYTLWNHPYAIIIMTAEVVTVGWLVNRRKMEMVLADTLYWLVIGMPLVYLSCHFVMDVPLSNTFIVMIKQSVNGIFNALVARLIFFCYQYRTRSSLLSFREIVYNLLAFFVLCPALIVLVISGRSDFARTDLNIRASLVQESQHVSRQLQTWVTNRKHAIVNLAEMASSRSPQQMQAFLQLINDSDDNFLRIVLVDRNANSTACSPLLDELGQSSIGINFADHSFIPILKQTLKPMLSDVIVSKIGISKPQIRMLAPVIIHGKYGGYVSGVLLMDQIKEYLNKSLESNDTYFTLIDRTGKIILTNRTDQKVMTPLVRGKGSFNYIDNGIRQWVPDVSYSTPASERWQKSLYVSETAIGSFSEWKLILEQPVAPFQKRLYLQYTGKLTLLFLVLLGALALAGLLSRRLMATLDNLSRVTCDLPLKLKSGVDFSWPESGLKETSALIDNFKETCKNIKHHVAELECLNTSLEYRVEERTADLLENEQLAQFSEMQMVISQQISHTGTWAYNLETGKIWWSAEGLRIYGFSPVAGDFSADDIEACIPERERVHQALVDLINEVQDYNLEFVINPADGSPQKVLSSIAMLEKDSLGYPLKVIGFIQDITERRMAEEALLEAKQFNELIIKSAREGVIVYDIDLRYQVWNPFMEQMSGMLAADVLGRHPSELFPFLQGSGKLERLEKVLAGEIPIKLDFQYLFPKSGKSGWSSDLSAPLQNVHGEIVGIISTVRDITRQKQLEHESRQALENATNANNKMNRLLRTIAHEFRTPLGLLTGSTDILDRYWDRLTFEKRFEQNENIRSAVRQMSNLINSMIAFNRKGVDSSWNHSSALNFGQACSAIVADVNAAWGTGQDCHVAIAADCGTALMDEMQFRRILENLLTNAFRYTPSDGTVSLHVSRERGRLFLEISDTGIGIPEEDQGLIFDAFYRSGNVEGRRGLGLGLSIVGETLTQMAGTISVISRVGEGTTMRVEIPVGDTA